MRSIPQLLAIAAACCALQAQAQTAPGGTPPSGTPPSGTVPGGTLPGTDSGTTGASLVGSTVTVAALYPDAATTLVSSSATVDAAVAEFSCPGSSLALCASTNGLGAGLGDGEYLDIGTTTISGRLLYTFDASTGTSFNGFAISGLNLGTGYQIGSFTLVTNIVGLDSSDITTTANSLTLNLMGLDPSLTTDGSNLGSFTITLNAVSAVAEPAPTALLASGLLMLGLLRRRRIGRGMTRPMPAR
jgi:hypothetical protein